jgi:predicted kinase
MHSARRSKSRGRGPSCASVPTTGNRVKQFQRTLAADLLHCGTTAIIEWGTWAFDERLQLRRDAVAVGARTELIVLAPSLETLWQRVVERGREDPRRSLESISEPTTTLQRPDAAEAAEAAAYDAFRRVEE